MSGTPASPQAWWAARKNSRATSYWALEGGHGYAAEKANHLADVLLGHKASLPGGNRRDGADRILNGLEIQSKYCKTGSRCNSSLFPKWKVSVHRPKWADADRGALG